MYQGKNILVLGLARSGYSVAKLLLKMGANITVNDVDVNHDPAIVEDLENSGVNLIVGSHPVDLLDNNNFDIIVKNPGVPLDHFYVRDAKAKDIIVTTEVEVAYNCMNDAKYIAITGTNGKTTTATLTYEILKRAGKDVHLVGNVGNPISNYYDVYNSETIFVVEVSAQQLYDCQYFKPDVAILTNLSEAHLEFFKNVNLYYTSKIEIFKNMTNKDTAIINADCSDSLEYTFDIEPKKTYFSVENTVDGGYYSDGDLIIGSSRFHCSDFMLVGKHNYQNILCAILAVQHFEVADEVIYETLLTFTGVAHRLEYVRNLKGVKYYNDSKSTNIKSCSVALDAFQESTTLILGGLERGQDFELLIPHMNYVIQVYCYGENKERIKQVIDKYKIACEVCNDLQDAVVRAHDNSRYGSIILFSPASASWDQFSDFEERGDSFKLIVHSFFE